jgi:hypothetical protein
MQADAGMAACSAPVLSQVQYLPSDRQSRKKPSQKPKINLSRHAKPPNPLHSARSTPTLLRSHPASRCCGAGGGHNHGAVDP